MCCDTAQPPAWDVNLTTNKPRPNSVLDRDHVASRGFSPPKNLVLEYVSNPFSVHFAKPGIVPYSVLGSHRSVSGCSEPAVSFG